MHTLDVGNQFFLSCCDASIKCARSRFTVVSGSRYSCGWPSHVLAWFLVLLLYGPKLLYRPYRLSLLDVRRYCYFSTTRYHWDIVEQPINWLSATVLPMLLLGVGWIHHPFDCGRLTPSELMLLTLKFQRTNQWSSKTATQVIQRWNVGCPRTAPSYLDQILKNKLSKSVSDLIEVSSPGSL